MRSYAQLRCLIGLAALPLVLGACDKNKKGSEDPAGANLIGANVEPSVGEEEDEGWDEGEGSSEFDDVDTNEEVEVPARKELPKAAKPVHKCRGKGKNKKCGLVDPKPKISAAHGVVALMGDLRWDMTPVQVFKILSKDIEKEYEERRKSAKDALAQDAAREWRTRQLKDMKANHIKFTTASKHRWGVSLIQYEYENDAEEEMLWTRTGKGVRKFYFFKNGELWKIYYAYNKEYWGNLPYEQVVEEKFKKWFGASPKEKSKQDPKTKQPVLSYYEWTALDNEKIRSFDMTDIHGVIALAVVNGKTEERIGERLPNPTREDKPSDVVEGVLGGSDVCYDKNGEITTCTEDKAVDVD